MATDLNSPEVRARIIEERWTMAVMDGFPQRVADPDGSVTIAPYMTKRWHRVTEAIEDIAGLVCEDGASWYETEEGPDSLEQLRGRIWKTIHDEIVAWASDERREVRRQAWIAREDRKAVAS